MERTENEILNNWIIVSRNIGKLYKKIYEEGISAKLFESLELASEYEDKLIASLPNNVPKLERIIENLEQDYGIDNMVIYDLIADADELEHLEIFRIVRVLKRKVGLLRKNVVYEYFDLNDKFLLTYIYFLDKSDNMNIDKEKTFYSLLFLAKELDQYMLKSGLKPIPYITLDLNLYVMFDRNFTSKMSDSYKNELFNSCIENINEINRLLYTDTDYTINDFYGMIQQLYLKSVIFSIEFQQRLFIAEDIIKLITRFQNDPKAKRTVEFLKYFYEDIVKTERLLVEEAKKLERKDNAN